MADGRHFDEFPIDIFQTGSGTSTNMNMNEVLANLAGERLGREVRPNNEPNASQSSNDVFPSAVHLAAALGIVGDLIPSLGHLAASLRAKQEEFRGVVKSGRTHLMDATPVTLGQEFGGYAASIEHGVERLEAALPRVAELPLGGTAVGTGLNADPALRRQSDRAVGRGDGLAPHRGPRPLRSPGLPRCARRGLRCAADDRRVALQDALTTSGGCPPARDAAWLRSTCPICSRARR